MKSALPIALASLALVAAGCGGGNDNGGGGGGGGSSATKTQKQSAGTAGGGKTVQASLKDIQFQPKTLNVKKGATVKWTNDDSVNHDVTKTGGPGPDFKSGSAGNLGQGASYRHTFTTAGSYKLVCTVHPGMEQTVTVK